MVDELAPTEQEISAAKVPHDIFLSNLIMNHILLFAGIATFGGPGLPFFPLVPFFSILALGYTFYRSSKVKREDSEFVYIHWQIARRWSLLFASVLGFMLLIAVLGSLANVYLGMMKEMVYALIGGLGLLPTLVTTLVLIVIESDSLHHSRFGSVPNWAKKKYLDQD